jgi:hypothetical protein
LKRKQRSVPFADSATPFRSGEGQLRWLILVRRDLFVAGIRETLDFLEPTLCLMICFDDDSAGGPLVRQTDGKKPSTLTEE